ncbi:MAG: HipA domain-containing protein [Archangium sp.]|nr:HipA domain-containing protein [Archangium sp.]
MTDARSVETLDVFRNTVRVGELRRTPEGGAVFEYAADFYEAHKALPGGIAVHLPYAQRTIAAREGNLHPYFAGLIPEGLRLRSLVTRAKTSEDDHFTLLVAAGADCVGDLFPMLPGSKVPPLEPRPEAPAELDRISFADQLKKSLESEFEPAVAGVQEKLSPSTISFPFASAGKRWILKLNPPERELLVENEHFFMTMARACGLDAAPTRLVHDRDGAAGLLVERFDRRREGRRWRGVHQEDACQLLNTFPADKYRLGISDIARGFGSWCDSPVVECARLIELVAFSYLIGNGDLHGKNISLSSQRGSLQLSPAYDQLSTRPYKDLKLALKFEGRDDNLTRVDFVEFGRRFGVAARAVEKRLDHLTMRAAPFIPRLKEIGYEERLTKQLEELMKKRLADL